MSELSGSTDFGRSGIWMGGLISPEAFLIATQQSTAQLNQWSLEDSELKFQFEPSEEEMKQAVDDC